MAEMRDAALLLRRIPYGDTSLILHVLTREHGRISLMARGARRAKSPFRAVLAPLCSLIITWRPGRTGMGTLVDTERGSALLGEERSLEGLQLTALAAGLFREGEIHGYAELIYAFGILAERQQNSGILAGAWYLLQKSGWAGPLDYCWHCASVGDIFQWKNAELCCPACGKGMAVSVGLRKGILGHMCNPRVYFPPCDLEMWRLMIQDILRHHGLKPIF